MALVILVSGGKLDKLAAEKAGFFLRAVDAGEKLALVLECSEPGARIVVADIDGKVLADTVSGSNVVVVDGLGLPDEDRSRALSACQRLGGTGALVDLVKSMQGGG